MFDKVMNMPMAVVNINSKSKIDTVELRKLHRLSFLLLIFGPNFLTHLAF